MDPQLEQIRDQQKETWNKFSSGWRKWDGFTMEFLQPMGDEIIRCLDVTDTDVVLDVAAGTGEPGLTIATMVTRGRVVITDLAEGMLDVARDNAAQRGITNYETVACDVCALPFDDATFDAVSCRFGFMFFPDMRLAAQEMARVLKPGGKLATAVWSVPEQNGWITTTLGTINRTMQLPAPPPDAPGMFRCGRPGFIADLFRQVGLKNVSEDTITGQVIYGSKDTYWQFMTDVVAPVVAAMSKADAATQEKIRTDVFALIDERYPGRPTALDYGAVVVCGEK